MLDSLFERVRKLEQIPDLQPRKDDSEADRLFFSRFQELLVSIEPRYAWFISEDLKRNHSWDLRSFFTIQFACLALAHIQRGEPFEFSPQLAACGDLNIEEDRRSLIQSKRTVADRDPDYQTKAAGGRPLPWEAAHGKEPWAIQKLCRRFASQDQLHPKDPRGKQR